MSDQKKASELNSSNCYLIKYWHYTVWAKIRSGLKDAEPDNSLHAHWHFVVEPSKVELRFWEVAKVLWKLEQLLSINYWNWFSMATAFSLIAVNFETEIVQDMGPLRKTAIEEHKYWANKYIQIHIPWSQGWCVTVACTGGIRSTASSYKCILERRLQLVALGVHI